MEAKQRYQLFHLCVQRKPGSVRRHNTGIGMELRSSPGSFVRLLIFGVLDSHDGVSGFCFSHGNRLERRARPLDLLIFSFPFSLYQHTHTKQDHHSVASCTFSYSFSNQRFPFQTINYFQIMLVCLCNLHSLEKQVSSISINLLECFCNFS